MKTNIDSGDHSPKIQFPVDFRDQIWTDVPPGNHRAKLHSFAKYATQTGTEGYKLTWIFPLPDDKGDYKVSNIYVGNGQQLLWAGLKGWLGEDLFTYYIDSDGCFHPNELLGLEADIEVKHVKTDSHETPLCRATRFAAPGTWVKDTVKPVTREEQLIYGLN